jgi:hypothetical protein
MHPTDALPLAFAQAKICLLRFLKDIADSRYAANQKKAIFKTKTL